jgi:hypothetical protein
VTKSEENMTTVEVFAMGVADALYAASYHMLKRPKAWQETQIAIAAVTGWDYFDYLEKKRNQSGGRHEDH